MFAAELSIALCDFRQIARISDGRRWQQIYEPWSAYIFIVRTNFTSVLRGSVRPGTHLQHSDIRANET